MCGGTGFEENAKKHCLSLLSWYLMQLNCIFRICLSAREHSYDPFGHRISVGRAAPQVSWFIFILPLQLKAGLLYKVILHKLAYLSAEVCGLSPLGISADPEESGWMTSWGWTPWPSGDRGGQIPENLRLAEIPIIAPS